MRSNLIQVSELSHNYACGRSALKSLNLVANDGERIGIVGPNGAGKTTLFLKLCGVIPSRLGQIQIAGLDPADSDQRRQLPNFVGVVFQNPDDQLFGSCLLDDVAFGPLNQGLSAKDAAVRAEDALVVVGLAGFGDRVPHKLSGGEKRRAALAGVLAMRPEILLLDEPTVFLDPRGRREFITLLNQLSGTILIATHDLGLVAETCSRAMVLDNGQISFDGSVSELFNDPERLTAHGLELPSLPALRPDSFMRPLAQVR